MTVEELAETLSRRWNVQPELWASAPGRVNILGEHTDYNQGFVLPAAIDRQIRIVASPREDRIVRVFSSDFNQSSEFELSEIERSSEAPWSNYIRGVFEQYLRRAHEIKGMDLVVGGDVPIGAGLSSSAALEVAVAETIRALNSLEIDKTEMAQLCQTAEGEFVGVQCGIMDQFVSALAQEDAALFIDCRDLSYQAVQLSSAIRILVCDSGVRRSLDDSAYNTRRCQCEEAVSRLRPAIGEVRSLREVSLDALEQQRSALPLTIYKRARHVISENERVRRGLVLLDKGRTEEFGQLLYESHRSLQHDYEVSCPELDILVLLAGQVQGTVGARMTGAGFGGCTVNLVEQAAVSHFTEIVSESYIQKTHRDAHIYVCSPSRGVRSSRFGKSSS
jgi:galactokinase